MNKAKTFLLGLLGLMSIITSLQLGAIIPRNQEIPGTKVDKEDGTWKCECPGDGSCVCYYKSK